MGRIRRAIAALLALVLLALPGAPMRHASAASLHAQPACHAQVHGCPGHDGEVAPAQAVASHHDEGGAAARHPGDQPGPGCCSTVRCPATVAVPSLAPAQPLALPIARASGFVPPPAPDGVGVDPALRPPRALA